MNVLGISGGVKIGNQDGAAALLIDGQLVAAAEEERFVGIKFANGQLPKNAIGYCLRHARLEIQDIDIVVFAGATYDRFEEILERFFEFNFGHTPRVTLVDHHTAHAASALFSTGWDSGLAITMDFSGDRKCTTIQRAEGNTLQVVEEIFKPNSLGIFYSAVTQYLGFQKDSDEYKGMGMAAYGEPRYDFSHILEVTERAGTGFTATLFAAWPAMLPALQNKSGCLTRFRSPSIRAFPARRSRKSIMTLPHRHSSSWNRPYCVWSSTTLSRREKTASALPAALA